jgi:hypothetical protein
VVIHGVAREWKKHCKRKHGCGHGDENSQAQKQSSLELPEFESSAHSHLWNGIDKHPSSDED